MKYLIVLVLCLMISVVYSQPSNHTMGGKTPIPDSVFSFLQGYWKGKCAQDGKERTIELEFDKSEKGVPEILWSIRESGNFRKPFLGWKWNDEKKSLICEGGFFQISYNKDYSKRIDVTIARHQFVGHCSLSKTEPPKLPYKLQDISFNNGEVKLAGSLTIPSGKGKRPAIIFLHGSGDATRWEWAPYFADIFTRMGIVCLFYDKRGCGQSTGNWITSSLDDLSDDANKAFEYLQSLDFVDKSRIGFWGFSQSAWVVSNCCKNNSSIAFSILCSGGINTPRETEDYGYRNSLSQRGFKKDQIDSALLLVQTYMDYLAAKVSLVQLNDKIAKVSTATWLKPLGIERIIPPESWRSKWSWVPDWDPLQKIVKINFPLLIVFGSNDDENDVTLAMQRCKEVSLQSKRNVLIKVFDNANHGIRMGEHSAQAPLFWEEFAPGYVDLIKKWAKKNIVDKKNNISKGQLIAITNTNR